MHIDPGPRVALRPTFFKSAIKAPHLARVAAMGGEVPEDTPALTLNRLWLQPSSGGLGGPEHHAGQRRSGGRGRGRGDVALAPRQGQHSSTSIMVRTRVVTAGSAGVGEWPLKLRS